MSLVHDEIAVGAVSVQKNKIREVFKPYLEDLKKCSWYPDLKGRDPKTIPNGTTLRLPAGDTVFLYPDRPRTNWQRGLEKISQSKFWSWCGNPPLDYVYLCEHYMQNAVDGIKSGDIKFAVKFLGVYSHVIADVIEPGHAVFDWAIDFFAPAPKGIFTNKERLSGPVSIKGYQPKILGENIPQASMGAVKDLIEGSRFGASLAIPMEQALYSGQMKKAKNLSSRAQNESAKIFADFIYTAFYLASHDCKNVGGSLDLCTYPFISAETSCYCRFRPLVDVFWDPSALKGTTFFKTLPLTLCLENSKKAKKVHGLSVIPKNPDSEATVEYFIVPKAYGSFTASVGLNPSLKNSLPFVSAVFTVYGDGKKLAGKTVRSGQKAEYICAELGGAHFLTLAMKFAGNLSQKEAEKLKISGTAAHGIWAYPVLNQE